MIRRFIHDMRRNSASRGRILLALTLWILPIALVYGFGIGYLSPLMTDKVARFLTSMFGSSGDTVLTILSILALVLLFVWVFKVDSKNVEDPSLARYMPGWTLRMLGKTRQERLALARLVLKFLRRLKDPVISLRDRYINYLAVRMAGS